MPRHCWQNHSPLHQATRWRRVPLETGFPRLRHGALLALVAGLVVVGGCGTSDKEIFERAQQEYAHGQFEEALKYFRLLSDEHPDSRWADRALERQALILEKHLAKPEEAVRLYQRLVSQFPHSALAPEAQVRIGDLSYRKLHRYQQALAAYERALADFGDDPELTVRVRLALGEMDYHEGKWQGVHRLTAVLRDENASPSQCAEAQFYLARMLENVKRDAGKSIPAYQKVIDNYPHTKWADEAKKAIGWIYYYTNRAQQKAAEAAKRAVIEVKRPAAGLPVPSFLTSVGDCLRVLGVEASPAYLMGVSGLAFQFYYDRNDRLGGVDHLPQNPLTAICRAVGVRLEQRQAPTFKDGVESLTKVLDSERPVFLPVVLPPPTWVTAVGYNEADKTITVVGPAGKARELSWEDLAKRWSTRSCPSLDPTNRSGARYTWYGFRKNGPPLNPTRTAELAVLAGTRIMKDRRSGAFAAGFRAYEEVIDDLQTLRDYAGLDRVDRDELLAWATKALPRLIAARQAAAAFLRQVAPRFSPARRAFVTAAAAQYDQVVSALQTAPLGSPQSTSVPPSPGTASGVSSAGDSFASRCRATATALQRAAAAERAAVAEMERVCR